MKRIHLHYPSWMEILPMMLLSLAVMVGPSARAQVVSNFTVGNLYYYLLSADAFTVEVTGGNDVSGSLVIPARVTYDGITYQVTQVGSGAFQGNDAITSLAFEEGVEAVGFNAFDQCHHIKSIHIPASMNSLYPGDDNPFSVEDDLESIVVASGNTVYDSRGGCNAIIETATSRMIAGCKTTIMPATLRSIAYDTFQRAAGMTEVTIAEGVTWIEHGAFENCQDLVVVYSKAATAYPIDADAFNITFERAELRVPIGSKASYEATEGWKRFSRIVEVEGGGTLVYGDGELQPDGTVTWTTFQGAKMTFKVIDAEKKWVQVGNGIVPSISQATTGEVTIPNEIVIDGEAYTVVGIGDYGFYNCDKLTAVWLPESLQFIGKYAFYGCKLIGKIQIPQTVYAIDNTAFEGCTGLSEFSSPYIDGFNYPSCPVTIIGYKASDEDYDVVIPQAVTSIGERAFSLCASIRTMRVEEGNTVFDSRNNCNAIIRTADNVLLFGCKGTMIPETVTAIDAYAFEGHNGLATIAIPAAVVNIGEGAFAGCTGLTAVTSNIQQPYAINDNTFSATTYQTATLYVPYGKKSLYQTTNGWKNFQNIMEMDEEEEMTLEYTDPTSNVVYVYTTTGTTAKVKAGNMSNWTSGSPDASGNVVILDKITVGGKQYTVNEIADLALYGNNITSITIPATVEKVGKYACYGWYLSNVTVLGSQPAVLTNSCFSEQTYQHATLNLPVGTEDVYFNANGWKEFFSFVKKDGIVYHISSWDQHTAELAGVESIFNGSLDISPSIDCRDEQYNVTQVMFNAFHSNSSITELRVPASMQLEYYDQYYDWRNIDNPFSSCVNLNTITVAEENPLYDSRNNCNAIIETETNVLLIGCNTTVIPDNIETIARDAFYGATFTEITIPASVQRIGDIAFGHCNNLNAFKVLNETPCSLDENVFAESSHNVFQYATLYVPKGSKAAYESAEVWKNFTNIVEMDVTVSGDPVVFADAEVKRICIENWDTNKDGELSYSEAATVTDLGKVFQRSQISTFDELQYFTGLSAIGEAAFSYSTINHIVLPNGIKTIKSLAFNSCSKLKTIDFPSTLQEIETNAFFYGGLTQIAIPKTITSIGIEPFFACPIETITVDSENPYYDSRENCHALIETATNRLIVGTADAFIPNTVTSIGGGAFYGNPNRSRTTLEIPSSVVNIERCILRGNTAMTSLHIPASVKTINREAFDGVENLSVITVDPDNTNYDSRNDCNAIIETATNILIRGSIAATIPEGVEKISNYAYYENNLTSVVIPNSVREIGSQSFAYCYKLKSIEIPSSVTSIGGSAFSYSPNVEVIKVHIRKPFALSDRCFTGFSGYAVKENATLYVPFGTKSLYEQTDGWKDFKNIVEMEMDADAPIDFADAEVKRICVENWDSNGDGELSYGEAAAVTDLGQVFKENKKIRSFEELQFFTGLTNIADHAFFLCTYLKDVIIPNNVKSIDEGAFWECDLPSLLIPNSVTNIGNSAFLGCEFSSLIIPNSVLSIGEAAFEDSKLTSITIPSSVTSIGFMAFSACSNLTSITVEDGNIKFDSRDNCNAVIEKETNTLVVGIQSTVIPNTVTTIGEYAFYNCIGLENVTIPNSVTAIDDRAFYACDLAAIIIPKNIEKIGSQAFSCGNLSSIIVEEGNVNYDSRDNCNAIIKTNDNTLIQGSNNTVIPISVTAIGYSAFMNLQVLASIVIPENVVSIGEYAFNGCKNLTSVTISNNVVTIGRNAFRKSGIYNNSPEGIYYVDKWVCGYKGNKPSNAIVINEGTRGIAEGVFNGCSDITSVSIPNTVVYICQDAFSWCTSLQSVIIPNSVQSVGQAAFFQCSNLKSVELSNSMTLIEKNTFWACSSLESFSIPNSVTTIGGYSFWGCTGLKNIKIGNSVANIGDMAFYNCYNLENITIPFSVKHIGESAFRDCSGLTSVSVESPMPITISTGSFYNREAVTLYVPYGSKSAYETADVWKDFKEIIEVKPDNFLYAEETTMKLGGKKTIALQLDNTESLIAAEFRLQLPAGLTIEKDENGKLVSALVTGRIVNHTMTITDEGNGVYHFLVYSGANKAFKGNAGDFITMSVVSDGTMAEGAYTATLKEIKFSGENEQKLSFVDSSFNIEVIDYMPGDVNGDKGLDVYDVVKTVNYILGRNPEDFKVIAADIDGNGKVNVMDLVHLIDLIMAVPAQPAGISAYTQAGNLELSKSSDDAVSMSVPLADHHVAAQFVVTLTDGSTLQGVATDEAHQSRFVRMADGRYKVMVFSGSNATFYSDSPIKLQLSGNGDVKIEDAMFVDTDEEAVAFGSAALNTTGITTVGTTFAQPVDIYTVGGKLVKNGATSTKGLAKGVYVVNKQKLIVK